MKKASAKSSLKQISNIAAEEDQPAVLSDRRAVKSGTSNGQQPLSSATESQENMDVHQGGVPKDSVRKNRQRTKRGTRVMAADNGSDGVGTVAVYDASVALQTVMKKRAPRNKTSKKEHEQKVKLNRKRTATDGNQSGSQRKRVKLDKKERVVPNQNVVMMEQEQDQNAEQQQEMKEHEQEERNKEENKDENKPEQENRSNSTTDGGLEIAVAKDDIEINIISPGEKRVILEEVKDFIELKRNEMLKKDASNQNTGNKWAVVNSSLKGVATVLSRNEFFDSPLSAYNQASKVFRDSLLRCGHQKEEEQALLDIFREFSRIMSKAFCCGRFFTATLVGVPCKGHTTSCRIEDGDLCYEKGKEYYCSNWIAEREGKTRGMKKIIYRHFKPEKFEECSCKTVWHPKCRLTRLLKKRNNQPCRNTNDLIQFQNFSKSISSTEFQRKLSEYYHKNRGNLPEVNFIHSKCIKRTPDNTHTKNALPNPEEYTFTSNQVFVTVLIENVDTMIFSFNTQEYRSGPKKGWVVIELLDSLSILKANRSKIYKRIIWSYLKYARDSGFRFAHLYSCAAGKGVDYIFGGHPLDQVFLEKDPLDQWYEGLFEQGEEEFGTMNTGYAKVFFEEALSKSSVSEMRQSLVFGNGFWNDKIEEILGKLPEKENDHFDYFKKEIQNVRAVSERSLFYVKLTEDGAEEKEIEDVHLSFSGLTGDCEKFLDTQYENDIEFTDLRQAQYGTRQILMELYLSQGTHNLERNKPKASSVFSSKPIVPTWNH